MVTPTYILGISAFYHDSAACLLGDGEILIACQEERFTRKKHDFEFPRQAVQACLAHAGIEVGDLAAVAFYDKPLLKFERILETYLAYAPHGLKSFLEAIPLWLTEKMRTRSVIQKELGFSGDIYFTEHHESHAASAFFPSPYQDAAILTLDGVGEWATASYGVGQDNHIKILGEIHFPHSLGLLYSAFTAYTGFKVNSGEYKVMGLAPYGEPRYADVIKSHLINIKADGSFRLNMKYFNYCTGLTMTNKHFHALFGGPPRQPESPVTQRDMDLAASIQIVTEEVMLKMAHHVHRVTGKKNLCLAGGVALNCVGNGKILRQGPFDSLWIQPAAGDAGGALGSASFIWHQIMQRPRQCDGHHDSQKGSLLGPCVSDQEIKKFLQDNNIPHTTWTESNLLPHVAQILAQEKVVGWFAGRMEYGPRALGARSILGDPRSEKMQSVMNLKIKFRESFRPFAPAVKRERARDYFELDADSPYMLLVAPVQPAHRIAMTETQKNLFGIDKLNVKRSDLPAVTHVDYSARLQTVDAGRNPLFYRLLCEFEKLTGCPVLINTSFNVRGEPIVCTPQDAYRCFMRTHMDTLVLGPYLLDKSAQAAFKDAGDWQKEFALD